VINNYKLDDIISPKGVNLQGYKNIMWLSDEDDEQDIEETI
jgi:hypothetical protein